jgi:hypothetical protein
MVFIVYILAALLRLRGLDDCSSSLEAGSLSPTPFSRSSLLPRNFRCDPMERQEVCTINLFIHTASSSAIDLRLARLAAIVCRREVRHLPVQLDPSQLPYSRDHVKL